MSVLIDSHVHIYPHYDINSLLFSFEERVVHAKAGTGVMLLTERYGTDIFHEICNGDNISNSFNILQADETAVVLNRSSTPETGINIVIVSGRQISCAERVEVLALATRAVFNDGYGIYDSINSVINAGGVPVLAWGVGKWMFKRESIIESVLERFTPEQILIGDTSLRPVFWRRPKLMRLAMKKGYKVIAGSDPLSLKGDEQIVGQYANLLSGVDIDISKAVTPQIVEIVRSRQMATVGRRAGLLEFIRRMK